MVKFEIGDRVIYEKGKPFEQRRYVGDHYYIRGLAYWIVWDAGKGEVV